MKLNSQVAALLERVARSPLPPYHTVPAHVARRIYRDTRAALAPRPPPMPDVRLLVFDGVVAVRAYRPVLEEVLPALVFFHGGGWIIGDLDTHDVVCRQLAAGARCAVFSVDYRLAPEHPFPAAVDDCFFATKYVSNHSKELDSRPKAHRRRRRQRGRKPGGGRRAHGARRGRPALVHQLLIYPATDQRCEFPSHERNGEGYLLTKDGIRFFRGGYLPNPATVPTGAPRRCSPQATPTCRRPSC